MSLRSWFNRPDPGKQKSSRLDSVVSAVVGYLRGVLAKNPSAEVRPALLAQVLNESELAILAALHVLEKKGVVEPHYGLYCSANSTPIDVYSSLAEVLDESPCEVCDEEHSLDDRSMYTELFFTVNPQQLNLFRLAA